MRFLLDTPRTTECQRIPFSLERHKRIQTSTHRQLARQDAYNLVPTVSTLGLCVSAARDRWGVKKLSGTVGLYLLHAMEGSCLWMPDTQRTSKSSCLGSPSPEPLGFTFSPLATGPELLIKDPQNTLSDGQKPWTLETMQVCSGRNAVHTCAEWGLVYQGSLKGPCLWHGVAFTTYGTC